MPHLALPLLAGYLRRRGHTVVQRDLNAEAFDVILTRKMLRQSLERIQRRFNAPGGRHSSHANQPDPQQVQWALKEGKPLSDKVEAAKAVLRSPAFYDPDQSEQAFATITAALDLYSLAYFPARLDLTSFVAAVHVDRSTELLKGLRDTQTNPFYDLFSHTIARDLKTDPPDLVGISVSTMGQFLPALTAAACLRDAGLTCHITMGGPHISMLREQFPQVPRLFDLIDSVVVFDGEIPLLRLAETLEQHGSLAEVPNLIYADPSERSQIHTNRELEVREGRAAQMNETPDFDGLPLERYLAPEPVLPLATAHGCYYGKCAFCNVGYGSPFHYYPFPIEQIVAQMEAMREKYNCRHIFFADEAITPRILRELGEVLGPKEERIPLPPKGVRSATPLTKGGESDSLGGDRIVEGMPSTASFTKEGKSDSLGDDRMEGMTSSAPLSKGGQGGFIDGEINWGGAVRFEKSLSDAIITAAGPAGCRMMLFGLESASEPVMRAMVKGTLVKEMSRILHTSTQAGIWNHTFFFFGFPGETLEDAQETVNFVYAHQNLIHSTSPGAFVLERYSPAHYDPAGFGITRVILDPQADLAIYFSYETAKGMDEETSNQLAERLIEQLPDKRNGHYYISDVYKFLYASELHRKGQPLPGWIG